MLPRGDVLDRAVIAARTALPPRGSRGGKGMRGKQTWIAVALVTGLALAQGSCAERRGPEIPTGSPVAGAVGRVVNLDQGWSERDQQSFWFTAQGSYIVPYTWFLALEQAASADLFRADGNIERLRYLPARPTKWNPDGLPVGFVRSVDAQGRSWMGFTCAACHTGQVDYRGTGMRIDGGPTLADAQGFLDDLVAALRATNGDGAKFDRFARRILGAGYGVGAADDLHRRLFEQTVDLAEWSATNVRTSHPYGHARWDAFGTLLNQFLVRDLGIPDNVRPADAPVSYPYLWDSHQCDRVQWNGSAFNAAIGPLARNVGEILGVFGALDVDPHAFPTGYRSSANIDALGDLENTLGRLDSPLWPTAYLPPIDAEASGRGKEIYQQNCERCHALIDRTDPARKINVVMVPVEQVGTDPLAADNFARRTGKTGRLEGGKQFYLAGKTLGAEASGGEVLDNLVMGAIVRHPLRSIGATVEDFENVRLHQNFDVRSYRARPLDGIWATAPFLHNGSVPSLWELLKAPDQRVKEFYVGSRELDPVGVGLASAPSPGAFRFDTSQPGNSNGGHPYGTRLADAQKRDLIEFLKSL
jgi:hypothetical protein